MPTIWLVFLTSARASKTTWWWFSDWASLMTILMRYRSQVGHINRLCNIQSTSLDAEMELQKNSWHLSQCLPSLLTHIDDSVQDCSISSALAMEILQSCTEPCSLWICHYELLYIYGINDAWILIYASLGFNQFMSHSGRVPQQLMCSTRFILHI